MRGGRCGAVGKGGAGGSTLDSKVLSFNLCASPCPPFTLRYVTSSALTRWNGEELEALPFFDALSTLEPLDAFAAGDSMGCSSSLPFFPFFLLCFGSGSSASSSSESGGVSALTAAFFFFLPRSSVLSVSTSVDFFRFLSEILLDMTCTG